jgi:two-component sensor histidine kinase
MSRTVNRAEVLLAVPPRPDSARQVRRALESEDVPEDIAHTLLLLSTEIVGNSIRHAGLADDQRIVFYARLRDDFARVEVADPGIGFDPNTVETEGFGLRLLEKLASRWGVEHARGCKVWFEVDRRSGRFDRSPHDLD